MHIKSTAITRCCPEQEIYGELLDFDGKTIIELGCGDASHTRAIAEAGQNRQIIAYEVDQAQHAVNLADPTPPNLSFREGGAESIDYESSACDIVLMFKSLHHVPMDSLDRALEEIARVLKPGGHAYISEPIFAGAFNDIIRLFHDEQRVRQAAFDAVTRAVDAGILELVAQTFFLSPVQFQGFQQFEQRLINATHTDHRLNAETLAEVKAKFEAHLNGGAATFKVPMRVDLLKRAEAG